MTSARAIPCWWSTMTGPIGTCSRPSSIGTAGTRPAPERAIMRQTSHRSVEMVRRYIRAGSLFQENAAAYVGL